MSLFLLTDSDSDLKNIGNALRGGGYAELFFSQSVEDACQKLALDPGVGLRQPIYNIEMILISLAQKEDALNVCIKIKSSIQYQDVPVILVSDSISPEEFQASFAAGVSDFITKPIRDFELLGRVRYSLKLKFEIDRRKARERELMETTMQLSDLNRLLTRLSMVDSLTGIGNRRCFDVSYEQEWRRAQRNARPIGLVFIDIDYFKLFNDHYGHQAGDDCLKSIVQIMRKGLKRPGDVLSRYGGEEFAVILPDTPLDGAMVVGRTIHKAVLDACIPNPSSGCSKFITISAGVTSIVPTPEMLPTHLIETADRCLYSAKIGGRNQVKNTVEANKKAA